MSGQAESLTERSKHEVRIPFKNDPETYIEHVRADESYVETDGRGYTWQHGKSKHTERKVLLDGLERKVLLDGLFVFMEHNHPIGKKFEGYEGDFDYIKEEILDSEELIEEYRELYEQGEFGDSIFFKLKEEDGTLFTLWNLFHPQAPVGQLSKFKSLYKTNEQFIRPEEELEKEFPGLIENANKISGIVYPGERLKTDELKEALEVGLWLNENRDYLVDEDM